MHKAVLAGLVAAVAAGLAAPAGAAPSARAARDADAPRAAAEPFHQGPVYPMQARHRWEEGCVLLRFTVRPDGLTDDFAVLESQPRGVFESAVIGAVYRWRYPPAAAPRTLVKLFTFRNIGFGGGGPRYSVSGANREFAGHDASGLPRHTFNLHLRGYRSPECTPPHRAHEAAGTKRRS